MCAIFVALSPQKINIHSQILELHTQVNFLGPYTLTRRLLPALEQTAIEDGEAIIVNVVSVMHR